MEENVLRKNLNVLADCINTEKTGNVLKPVNNRIKNEMNISATMKKIQQKDACIQCSQSSCVLSCDKENRTFDRTPQKCKAPGDPITPTANLKMLVCAASVLAPALPNIEEEKRKLFDEPNITSDITDVSNDGQKKVLKKELMGRKEKSLGLLCKKFINIYPEYSANGTTILLDDVVKALSIGRRRVYDIVNVLESMEMMVRQAKNKYLWFGKSRLASTLTKLKALAIRVYGPNFSNVLKNSSNIAPKPTNVCQWNGEPPVDALTNSIMDNIISYEKNRRDCNRSLGILCQKFIMLFMVVEERVVTLEKAAKFLITEPDEGPAKYKTKVRRLYDIANILTSINFLEKTVSYEDSCKKAAYKWIGVDLNSLNSAEETNRAFQSQEFSLTRHSLLSTIPRKHFQDTQKHLLKFQTAQLKFRFRSASAHQLTSPGSHIQSSGKVKFPRTFSATNVKQEEEDDVDDVDDAIGREEVICESGVAEKEDGFDVEKWSVEITPPPKGELKEEKESPSEVLFKEKILNLQKEFPDKLPNNGLLQLLSACRKNQPKPSVNHALRRSLSSDFNKNENAPPAKKQKVESILLQKAKIAPKSNPDESTPKNQKVETILQQNAKIAPRCGTEEEKPETSKPLFYAALKPLISYSHAPPKSTTTTAINLTSPSSQNVTANRVVQSSVNTTVQVKPQSMANVSMQQSKVQHAAFLTLPSSFKQASGPTSTGQSSLLLSPVNGSLSLTKNGYVHLIPVQCRPTVETGENKSQPFIINAPTTNLVNATNISVQQQQQQHALTNMNNSRLTSPLPMFRAHLTNSPSNMPNQKLNVKASSKFAPSKIQLNQAQILTENYPEFVTPPRVVISNMKPAANPISFPKMTPETPSSATSLTLTLMNSVTRKLMTTQEEKM